MYDEYLKIPYVIGTFLNSPNSYQILTKDKKNMWIISINREDPRTNESSLDNLHHYQAQHGKYEVKMSL